MKILKQGTFATNQCSLASNEHSDFTRRIPTGLSDKQMNRDARIASKIIRAYEDGDLVGVLDLFFRKAKLLSNPRYWETMRTVWVAIGCTENAQRFRALMKSQRPCKGWFMTPEDAAYLDSLDFPIMVWRAWDKQKYGDNDPGISWTIDYEWCKKYAEKNSRAIKMRIVGRERIFAYISRRAESEIIILD